MEGRRPYLADLELQQVGPVRQFLLTEHKARQFPPYRPHAARQLSDTHSQWPQFRVPVQQIDVLAHPQQRRGLSPAPQAVRTTPPTSMPPTAEARTRSSDGG